MNNPPTPPKTRYSLDFSGIDFNSFTCIADVWPRTNGCVINQIKPLLEIAWETGCAELGYNADLFCVASEMADYLWLGFKHKCCQFAGATNDGDAILFRSIKSLQFIKDWTAYTLLSRANALTVEEIEA